MAVSENAADSEGDAMPGQCSVCGHAVVAITIIVEGNPLNMASCQHCDTRSWRLGGAPVQLEQVLEQVGSHSGRRR